MKVARYHEHGAPEVLRYEEVPDPIPGTGEVLVRVRACSVNHLDLRNRSPQGAGRMALPRIPGADIAGEVVAWGGAVDAVAMGLKEGQPVLVHPGLSCGRCPECIAGQDNLCPDYKILGWQVDGGYAEMIAVPAASILPFPARLGYEEAAAFPLVFLAAWHMLVSRAQLRPAETLLVLGASGGVGSAAAQIGALLGARVLATVSRPEKAAGVRELGAEPVAADNREDLPGAIRELTGGRGVDVVVDHSGQAGWKTAMEAMARGGRLVNCGATSGTEVSLDLRRLYRNHLSVLGSFMGSRAEMLRVIPLVAAGKLRPVLDRSFPLSDAAAAHRYLEERRHFGKVVLCP